MRRFKWAAGTLAVAAVACLLSFTLAQAKKPDKPGGGGGDGGSGSSTLDYDIYQLDSAEGAFSGFAGDLNDFGTVVGHAVDTSTDEGFAACWEVIVAEDGTVASDLCLLPNSSNAGATGVNNLGEIVGEVHNPGSSALGLYWPSASDAPLPLLPLDGDIASRTTGINDAGIIYGMSTNSEAEEHPVAWRVTSDGNGHPVVSGPFHLPSVNGLAWDLSELDEDGNVTVVGEDWDDESSAGVTWRVQPQEGGRILIDPHPTILQVGVNVHGVNNNGVACGNSSRPDWIAMVWTATDQIPLARPRKFEKSSANDLNDSGVVVGWLGQDGAGFPREPAVWAVPDAKPVLLSSFLGRKSPFDGLTGAPAINQAGVIVGVGWDADAGLEQAFIALPK